MAVAWVSAPSLTESERSRLFTALDAFEWAAASEVYRIRHRSVWRAMLEPIGEVAIKEVRHLRFRQRLRFRYGSTKSKAETEFANACGLHQRLPMTPRPLAIGRDQHVLGLKRVLQIYQWLPNARTLTERVRDGERPWAEVAPFVWQCAASGLVHGGHSSENLLYSEGQWWVIDLADATLGEAMDRTGFIRDVARIARKLLREQAADDETVDKFVQTVAEHDAPVSVTAEEIRDAMALLLQQGLRRKR